MPHNCRKIGIRNTVEQIGILPMAFCPTNLYQEFLMKSLNTIVLILVSALSLNAIGCKDDMRNKEGVPYAVRMAILDFKEDVMTCRRSFGPGYKESFQKFYASNLVAHTKLDAKIIIDRVKRSSRELSIIWEKNCAGKSPEEAKRIRIRFSFN